MFGYAMLDRAADGAAASGAAAGGLRKAWGRGFALDNLTLHNFHLIFFEQLRCGSRCGTPSLCGVTARLRVPASASPISCSGACCRSPAAVVLCAGPVIIPGIVLAICFYAAYAGAPFALYGTAIIIVAFITRFLPIAFVTVGSGMRSINPELEEAVRILGGNRLMVLSRVVAPLLKTDCLAPGSSPSCWRHASCRRVFLSGPETRVISVLTLDLSEQGRYEILAAMGVVLLFVTTVVLLSGRGFWDAISC